MEPFGLEREKSYAFCDLKPPKELFHIPHVFREWRRGGGDEKSQGLL